MIRVSTRVSRGIGLAVALAMTLVPPAFASAAETAANSVADDALPRLRVPYVEKGPTVDGFLDDPVWAHGAPLQTLIQSEPNQGEAVSERTEIRLLRDDEALYFAIRCYDREPDLIIAQKMLRDESFNSEDRIALALDTFRDRRNGYFFQINPRGAKRDGLIENGSLNLNWDGIWHAKARIDEEGWVLELALPFKTFAFDPAGDEWGMKILRGIRRKAERARWAEPFPDSSFVNMAAAGVLEGMGDLDVGWGLDIVPALAVRYINEPDDGTSKAKVDPSVNIFYRITPALTAALTANTDFAETAVDEQRVNLSRFSLFFPEKREFFLRDAGIFDFGGLGGNGQPFFSRKIGLGENSDGDTVPYDIHVGGKLTGRSGRFNIGVLDTYVDSHGDVSAKNLFVGRVSANVLSESQVGIIATNGNPDCDASNTLVGGDFLYRNTRVFPQRTLTGRFWYQQSFTGDQSACLDKPDDDPLPQGSAAAYGARIAYPNDQINWSLGMTTLEKNFFPALGFVNRDDIRQYDGSYRFRVRPSGSRVRTADVRTSASVTTTTHNELDSATVNLFPIDLETDRGDGLELFYRFRYDTGGFDLLGIDIPAGSYSWHRAGVRLIVGESRPLGGELQVVGGGYYDGDLLQVTGLIRWRPSPHVFLSAEYEHSQFDLPIGSLTVVVARVRMNLQFSVDLSWNTFVQYDNDSDQIGINSRLRWIIQPGREFFLVLNQDLDTSTGELKRGRSEPVVKLGWTFRL